ncbi:MAG: RNA polymerase sigma factor [Ruminococcaceae bacterium]|nr:RNA polymerase sigma factor [Oscillospiraceae bacterium]
MDNGASSYRRFLAGDESGIVDIIRDYKDGLILYLNGYTKNIHIAEELMEETFVKLVVKKPRYTEKFSFKTWLYTIGRNAAIDWLRQGAHTVCTPFENLEDTLSDEEDLERSYIKEEQKIALHRAMERLNEDYRHALYLSYFEDLSNAEIARIMHTNKRRVENLIYRGKQSLKSELEKEGFVYEEL